ncbi:MAG: ComEC/Rec2 family competence protein [Flavobacteriales bacterium]|nr:MAG: ComEC/Rec2 family competence protein [Flavobacteriales bacterium]
MLVSDLHGPWSAIRRAPFVRMALPLVAGVAVGRWLVLSPASAAVLLSAASAAALAVILAALHPGRRWWRGAALMGWYAAFGVTWSAFRDPKSDSLHFHRAPAAEAWVLRIAAVSGTGERVWRGDAEVVARLGGDGLEPARGAAMLTLLTDGAAGLGIGDLVLVRRDPRPIDRAPDPGGFDRRAWAATRGIAHEFFAPSGAWALAGQDWSWTDAFDGMRASVSRWLDESALPVRERALVKALVLGLRDELDGGQRTAFARSGTIHVLAVSGMHVGLIYAVLAFLLGWWGRSGRARLARGIIILIALWCYAGLTGASPSVLRATVMFTLFTVAGMGLQRTDHINNLFAAALVLVVWDPSMIVQAGFQLSFLAVLGIILFYRPIAGLWSPAGWLPHQAWRLAVVSISAQVLTTPLSLFLFQAFPVWFLPANLIVVTAASMAVYGGVALLALHKVPLVGAALTTAMEWLLRIVGESTAFFAGLPHAYPAIRIGLWEAALLYVLIFAAGAWWQWGWTRMRPVVLWCAIGIAGAAWSRARSVNEGEALVVYDDARAMLAGHVAGRSLAVVAGADSALAAPFAAARIERHMRAHGIDALVPVGTDLFRPEPARHGHAWMAQGRLRSPRLDVLFVSDRSPFRPTRTEPYDAVVLHDLHRLDDAVADGILGGARQVVLASGLSGTARRWMNKRCAEAGVPCHDVRRQGAFILRRGSP